MQWESKWVQRRRKEHKLWGRQHPAAGVGVTAPQAEVNLSHTFVSQLPMQMQFAVTLANSLLLHSKTQFQSTEKCLPCQSKIQLQDAAELFSSRFCWTGHRKEDRVETCSKRFKRFKRMKGSRGVIEAVLKFEQWWNLANRSELLWFNNHH